MCLASKDTGFRTRIEDVEFHKVLSSGADTEAAAAALIGRGGRRTRARAPFAEAIPTRLRCHSPK